MDITILLFEISGAEEIEKGAGRETEPSNNK